MFVPTTPAAGAVLISARSAGAVEGVTAGVPGPTMRVMAEPMLFAEFGSFSFPLVRVTVALFVMVEPASDAWGVTWMVIVIVAPAFRVPIVQVTAPVDWTHEPWLGVMAPAVRLGGSWSVTWPLVALPGPLLVTKSV